MNWFKFFGSDYLSDPKMLSLTAAERSCWITLLSYASQDGGKVRHLTEEKLMMQSGIDFANDDNWDKTKGVLLKFKKLGMLQISNGFVTVCNWQKRQEIYSESYERVKKWRDKKQSVTLQKRPIDKNRIEKKKEGVISPRKISEDFFSDPSKRDSVILKLVQNGVPEDIARKEIEKFTNYWIELNPTGKKQRWEQQKTFEVQRRLATWFGNISKFGNNNLQKSKITFV